MMWREYLEAKDDFVRAQRRYISLVTKKEELYSMTLPRAIRYDADRVQTSVTDVMTDKLAQIADLGILITAAKEILTEREEILRMKRQELRQSRAVEDRIFTCYFLDGMGVRRIAGRVGYSRSQVFRILKKMRLYATRDSVK